MKRGTIYALAVGGFIIIAAACLWLNLPRIESDLTARSAAALQQADLPGISVRFKGQDGILTGVAENLAIKARAWEAVTAVSGVRAVDNQIEVKPNTAVAAPWFRIQEINGILHAGGIFADSIQLREFRASLRMPGWPASQQHDFTVDPSIKGKLEILPLLGQFSSWWHLVKSPLVKMEDKTLTISGSVPDSTTLQKLMTHLRSLESEYTIITELHLPSASPVPTETSRASFRDARIRFASGSADPAPGQERLLNQLADFLKRNRAAVLIIRGHSDPSGSPELNESLSWQRAAAVKARLVQMGIEPERLAIEAMGDAEPLASNATAEGRRQNRRVDFVIKENR